MSGLFTVLLTGSRDWTDVPAIIRGLSDACLLAPVGQKIVLRHGHNRRGADAIGDEVWNRWALQWPNEYLKPQRYPANWELCGKPAGALRNTEMVKDGADVCVAFPLPQSIGTYDCMRKAKKAGIKVINYGRVAA